MAGSESCTVACSNSQGQAEEIMGTARKFLAFLVFSVLTPTVSTTLAIFGHMTVTYVAVGAFEHACKMRIGQLLKLNPGYYK